MTKRLALSLAAGGAGLVVVVVAALSVVVLSTTAPELPSRLPTATPAPVLGIDRQVQGMEAIQPGSSVAQTGLAYDDGVQPARLGARCTGRGHWSLTVNPEGIVGRPFTPFPSAGDWSRAAQVVHEAASFCPLSVMLTWYWHDTRHPRADVWTTILPATRIAAIDGAGLRLYATEHRRQG